MCRLDDVSAVRQDFGQMLAPSGTRIPDFPQIPASEETSERIPRLLYDSARSETDICLHLLKQSILQNYIKGRRCF
jgi:hypothetical protein